MVYHLIIALNSAGKRRVGQIISILEKRGLEFLEIKKRVSLYPGKEFPTIGQLIFQAKLDEQESMNFYREKFDAEVLEKKIKHFYRNNVELLFESEEKKFDPNELWEEIAEHVFDNGRKLPLMFVVTTSEDDGFDGSFIPEDFELECRVRIDIRTLMPLGKWISSENSKNLNFKKGCTAESVVWLFLNNDWLK